MTGNACIVIFSRSTVDDSRSIIDNSRSVTDNHKLQSKLWDHKLTALEVTFTIVIFYYTGHWFHWRKGWSSNLETRFIGNKIFSSLHLLLYCHCHRCPDLRTDNKNSNATKMFNRESHKTFFGVNYANIGLNWWVNLTNFFGVNWTFWKLDTFVSMQQALLI